MQFETSVKVEDENVEGAVLAQVATQQAVSAAGTGRMITMEEVEKHTTAASAWFVRAGKVLPALQDVTMPANICVLYENTQPCHLLALQEPQTVDLDVVPARRESGLL